MFRELLEGDYKDKSKVSQGRVCAPVSEISVLKTLHHHIFIREPNHAAQAQTSNQYQEVYALISKNVRVVHRQVLPNNLLTRISKQKTVFAAYSILITFIV